MSWKIRDLAEKNRHFKADLKWLAQKQGLTLNEVYDMSLDNFLAMLQKAVQQMVANMNCGEKQQYLP
jgi:hypothetical protein